MPNTIQLTTPGIPSDVTVSIDVKKIEILAGGVLRLDLPNGDQEYFAAGTWIKVVEPYKKPPAPKRLR